MKWIIGFLFCTTSFAAGRSDQGQPVLPPEAIRTMLDSQSSLTEIRNGLGKIASIRWDDLALEPEVASSALEPAALDASLMTDPETVPIPDGPPPRNCANVFLERRQVRRWIMRVDELRRELDVRLATLEKTCRKNSQCDTRALNLPLSELNGIVAELNNYADREAGATPDRLVQYHFHLDGEAGRALLRAGWRPLGDSQVTRVHYFRSPWDTDPALSFGNEGKLSAAPIAQPDGTWIVQRSLTATHACVNGQTFTLEFWSNFTRNSGDSQLELIRAISL
jgi:hypothetical protein